jgi:hypothetical protein
VPSQIPIHRGHRGYPGFNETESDQRRVVLDLAADRTPRASVRQQRRRNRDHRRRDRSPRCANFTCRNLARNSRSSAITATLLSRISRNPLRVSLLTDRRRRFRTAPGGGLVDTPDAQRECQIVGDCAPNACGFHIDVLPIGGIFDPLGLHRSR